MLKFGDDKGQLKCSFCGKMQEQVKKLVKHTGQPLEKIQTDTERDFFMSSEQAKEYGIIDAVIVRGEKAESLK